MTNEHDSTMDNVMFGFLYLMLPVIVPLFLIFLFFNGETMDLSGVANNTPPRVKTRQRKERVVVTLIIALAVYMVFIKP